MLTDIGRMRNSGRISYALASLIFGLYVTGSAQTEIAEGHRYEAGMLLKVESLGIQLEVPADHTAVLPQGSNTLVIISTDQEITLLVSADEMDLESSKKEMMQATNLGNGLSLIPAGDLWQDKQTLIGEYRVAGSPQPLKSLAQVQIGSHGIGLVAIMIATPSKFAAGETALGSLFSSLRFGKPATAATSAGNEEWATYLKGKALKYFYTSNGFSSTDFIYLCSDGTFLRKLDDSSVSNLGTGVMHSGNEGRWHATGTGNSGKLVLTSPDGSQSSYELFYGEGNKGKGVYLSGSRYYVDNNDRCN